MKGGFRQSMTWLHTWTGLLFSWVLFFIFVTGTLGYFDTEIDHWMEPERIPAVDVPVRDAYTVAQAYLEENAVGADRWSMSHPSGRNNPQLSVFWQMPAPEDASMADPETLRGNVQLHTVTGEPLDHNVRETGGGQVLYRMHYALHYINFDIAYRLVGFITLLMFIGMISGIVVHKKIFKDFFTFRPARGQRSWLDMHNLLSVSSLPFLLMITYSGLLFVVTTWMPGVALGSYGFNVQKVQAELQGALGHPPAERSGTSAGIVDIGIVLDQIDDSWSLETIGNVEFQQPGDVNGKIIVNPARKDIGFFGESLVFDAVTGEFIEERPFTESKVIGVAGAMLGLHEGLFADTVTRWLYFIAGLVGTAMVATGCVYWTAKRRKALPDREQDRGFRFVECLNIGTIAGLPVAIAAYFWANRLLPVGMEHRAEWEVHVMFISWAACLLYPLFRPRIAAWRELFLVASMACIAIPALNAATTDVHLANSVPSGDWVMAGFDLTCIALGIGLAVLASNIRVRQTEARAIVDEHASPTVGQA
ncbi:MAG: PepSY-associated TM helix domain-containing protein [Pseudomonadota bacterium]